MNDYDYLYHTDHHPTRHEDEDELLDEIGAERFVCEELEPLLRASLRIERAESETPSAELTVDELDDIAALPPKRTVQALVQAIIDGRRLPSR